jgi:amino acid transporter
MPHLGAAGVGTEGTHPKERGAVESASLSPPIAVGKIEGQPTDKGLKANAIGYMSNLVIAVASTAPAYSMAATLGFVMLVSGMGLQAPAIILISFVPMLFISMAYKYMNQADPDCGTTFTWAFRAFGPQAGWLGGWGIITSDVLVMASLSQIAALYTFHLWYASPNPDSIGVLAIGVAWIVLMTWICYVGIELSARLQQILLTVEVITLAVFSVVALIDVYSSQATHAAIKPALSWFNPFDISSVSTLGTGVLVGIFIYWGWDSGVAVNEESEDSARGPGKAAVISTLLLLLIYVIVTTASQAYAGPHALGNNASDIFAYLSPKVFPKPINEILILTVLTSASASTQTTILPTARTSLAMARWGAIPKVFGRVHPTHQTPDVSTIAFGVISTIWFVAIDILSPNNVLGDSVSAVGFMVCLYYGITGFACAWYFRRELFKSARNFFFVGVAPLLGGLSLLAVFIIGMNYYGHQKNNYSKDVLGLGLPDVIGIGLIIIGLILGIVFKFALPGFYSRKASVADPAVLADAG